MSGADGAQFGHALVTLAASDDVEQLTRAIESAPADLLGYAAAYLAHTVADVYATAAEAHGVSLDEHLRTVGADLAAICEQFR